MRSGGDESDSADRSRRVPHVPDAVGCRTIVRSTCRDVELSAPRIPVVSNVDAEPHTNPDKIRELLTLQVMSVRFVGKSRSARCSSSGVEEFSRNRCRQSAPRPDEAHQSQVSIPEHLVAISAGRDPPANESMMSDPKNMSVDLSGQVAMVTGASRGLGKAMALTLGGQWCDGLLRGT